MGQESKILRIKEIQDKHYNSGGGGGLDTKSGPTLATPWTVPCQAPLSMGFSRQEYWCGLPFPSPGDLPDQELNPCLLHYG